jgi:hypothetical protein
MARWNNEPGALSSIFLIIADPVPYEIRSVPFRFPGADRFMTADTPSNAKSI